MASRNRSNGLTPDSLTARFLYAIIKQLDLKTVDWNEVAKSLEITNGHAARMRYSRFKSQIEGTYLQSRIPKSRHENKIQKTKDKMKRFREEEMAERENRYETSQYDIEQDARRNKHVDDAEHFIAQYYPPPWPRVKQEFVHGAEYGTEFIKQEANSSALSGGYNLSSLHPTMFGAHPQHQTNLANTGSPFTFAQYQSHPLYPSRTSQPSYIPGEMQPYWCYELTSPLSCPTQSPSPQQMPHSFGSTQNISIPPHDSFHTIHSQTTLPDQQYFCEGDAITNVQFSDIEESTEAQDCTKIKNEPLLTESEELSDIVQIKHEPA